MKAILCVGLVLASCAFADEATDRAVIGQMITMMHMLPDARLFTADFRDGAALGRTGGGLTVVISNEPLGEASLVANGSQYGVSEIRLITADVALVDGVDARKNAVLFVMKREGAEWKIAVFRRVAAEKEK